MLLKKSIHTTAMITTTITSYNLVRNQLKKKKICILDFFGFNLKYRKKKTLKYIHIKVNVKICIKTLRVCM